MVEWFWENKLMNKEQYQEVIKNQHLYFTVALLGLGFFCVCFLFQPMVLPLVLIAMVATIMSWITYIDSRRNYINIFMLPKNEIVSDNFMTKLESKLVAMELARWNDLLMKRINKLEKNVYKVKISGRK